MNRNLFLAVAGVGTFLTWQALRPRFDYRNRHVLITGGSRGLGLVMARQLAVSGARLTLCSRDDEELARAREDLATAAVVTIRCDVTDREQVRTMIGEARHRHGPIDVLINNAGVIRVGPMEAMTDDDYEQSLRTHFWAVYHACTEILPEMTARRRGRVVNIASIGGKVSLPHLLPYSVGKFALIGYSTGLRAEVARHGIVVTTVSPGLLRTGSHVNAEFKGRHDEEYAWFAAGNAMPGLSMSAESAACKILEACAVGDAELVLGLPAKFAAAAVGVCPNLVARLSAQVDQSVLPENGGIGRNSLRGAESREVLPAAVTAGIDDAAERNNELG